MNRTIALISCGKSKRSEAVQAKDLYTGDLFKKARSYAERNHDGWSILSALHHLVEPETEVEPYEKTLIGQPKSAIIRWSELVFGQIKERYRTDTTLYIYAGSDYRKFLNPMLEQAGYTVVVPLQGLGIGQQKSWFKQREA